MKYIPHKYQEYATDFIVNNEISAILLSMGLGKSIITLTAINELMLNRFDVAKILIIGPIRVVTSTWPNEIKKWEHLKFLNYSVVVGSEKERLSALNKPSHIYLINRENVDWLINKSGYKFDFDMLVIDEMSSFKSYQSKRVKSLLKVRPKIKRIVGLTGTPSSNGLIDLWAQFKILDLGKRLGRFISHYRNKYFIPDKRNGMVIYSYKPQENAEERIYEAISDITISMKSSDYLELPELVVNNIIVELNKEEKEKYNVLRKEMFIKIKDVEIDASNAASLSNKLLQMASGAVYDENKVSHKIHDKKLDALEDLIESANGKSVLVAYWFKSDLERISKRFDVIEIKTDKDIKDWNKGKIPVALIHPASAGHGLNLQEGGSILIWFSLTWSLELYQQTNARLHRQGQKETVTVYHIITKGTIDEDVIKSLKKKDKIQEQLINAVKVRIGG
ncbi:DEAD/DEAH box helicase [Gemelliphila palaticanis]|uniref:DEAD/DEAH box helicase n=1 Tax=Gemelliphila palaticanis TaxID=81950 RepID=A0ABX2SXP5_9BACL|nr:DEAD/DEAH box helicase [Gemella palaticanis]MBF0714964.1 DEAD/DEAH box helicase [Gemella palaticanis]NYS46894.1 DEAD/DEAH box helicase [Gemella palaticanis]